ncbi:hypothetical protein DPMN_169731 [Dreissena polymorpha]|uniref:Decapping nuclease n=1 Tax=Dreissena polymorpha TaxID=45954 RepID=A0A9D4IDM1_DREPO|nr:hypothetical protein DPMN_169731 [Dreissena polymorpha]
MFFKNAVCCCKTNAFDEDNNVFVELKTYVPKTELWDIKTFRRYKLLQWWTQGHVGGVREILCGHRDKRGIVTRLESFATDDIPSLCVEQWTPHVYFNFLDQLLTLIKEEVAETGEFMTCRTVHIFEWLITNKEEVSHHTTDEKRFQFFPEKYLSSERNI